MNRAKWQILLGIFLLALSAAFYLLHYVMFRDVHHIFIYLVGDVAFVFIEVLLVTLILHSVLAEREKRGRLRKLNMVIGVFFSEVGTPLLKAISRWDTDIERLQANMLDDADAPGQALTRIRTSLQGHAYRVNPMQVDWENVCSLLVGHRNFLVRLLENPNLLEHQSFTDLLWAVFHLTEELDARQDFRNLPDSDRQHLGGDVKRVYGQLALQWLAHMEHLSADYPYLFSLALRMNPFTPHPSPVVAES